MRRIETNRWRPGQRHHHPRLGPPRRRNKISHKGIEIGAQDQGLHHRTVTTTKLAKEAREVLVGALGKSIAAALEAVETHTAGCWDGVGLLLTLGLASAHKKGHVAKGFKGMVGYFDRIAMLVWPRWKLVFHAHLSTVQALNAALGKQPGGARPQGLPAADASAPHPLTQRFSHFKASATLLHVTALQGSGPPLEDPSLLPVQM